MKQDVLSMFESLSRLEAEQFRALIIPTLEVLRQVITGKREHVPVEDPSRQAIESALDEMDRNLDALAAGKVTLLAAKAKHSELSRTLYRAIEADALGTAVQHALQRGPDIPKATRLR